MSEAGTFLVVGVALGFVLWSVGSWLWNRRSCGGGHVWSERERTNRYRVTPYSYRPWKMGVEVMKRERCQRGQCGETRDHWERLGDVEAEAFREEVAGLIERFRHEESDDG